MIYFSFLGQSFEFSPPFAFAVLCFWTLFGGSHFFDWIKRIRPRKKIRKILICGFLMSYGFVYWGGMFVIKDLRIFVREYKVDTKDFTEHFPPWFYMNL